MSAPFEKSRVEQLISAYAEAVNTGNREAIAALYTEDGVLLPEGFTSVPQGRGSGRYFTKLSVNIEFLVKEVVIEGSFAFAEAEASTRLTDLSVNREVNKTTRDLFIFKNTEGDWKIYRYIFNSTNKA